MSGNEKRKLAARDLALGVAIVVTGLVISGVAVMQLAHGQTELVRAQQMQRPTPSVPAGSDTGTPAPAKPGGTRPTTPAPEPAQPGRGAQKEGAKPALPPAPAEKMAPPIKAR